MTTYAEKRHLLAWLRQRLIAELDEAQLFQSQRDQIVKYIDLTREIDETVTREYLAERQALKVECPDRAARLRARRKFWKEKKATA